MNHIHRNNIRIKPDKSIHFLIGGVLFGHHNVGDEAILEGVVNVLRKVRPNCKITVLTDEQHRTAKQLGVKAFKYQFICYQPGKINKFLRILSRIFENLLQSYLAICSDIVICGGATILSDSPAMVIRLASWAIFADKRLLYFPGGMNPGNSPDTLSKLLSMSKEFDLFMVRDIDTKKRLVAAGFDPDFIQVTVDPAFNITLSNDMDDYNFQKLVCFNNNRKTVGIGISNEPDCSKYNYPLEWAKIADFIVEAFNVNVVFLPSNTQPGKDLAVMFAAHNLMKNKRNAYVIDIELPPKEMIAIISKFEIMISSRMHQLIFSTLADTVFIGISRCAKTDSFLSMFGMRPASTVKDCKLEYLKPSLENVWSNREQIRMTIHKYKANLIARSLITEELLATCLDRINTKSHKTKLSYRFICFINAFFMRLG